VFAAKGNVEALDAPLGMDSSWPWVLLAGLGAYHGLNPAMGWLFAVALGLHRGSRSVVLQSLIPIALGHTTSIALAAGAAVALGLVVSEMPLRLIAGGVLILWGLYHTLFGRRHRAHIGMQAGFAGLFLWSFLMAGAHGAGLMLVPALIPLCFAGDATGGGGTGLFVISLLAVGLHTVAMLAVTAVIALLVYDWFGIGFLRRGWLNLDRIWTGALLTAGGMLLLPLLWRLFPTTLSANL
jgi:hypothetical protein